MLKSIRKDFRTKIIIRVSARTLDSEQNKTQKKQAKYITAIDWTTTKRDNNRCNHFIKTKIRGIQK